ncbi:BamA/TamA family outer membrane protein [Pleurocapsales cyanobacterium LEGE 10410]|nr:BamA/TamA family outer membrane protein [Pleurocapsales cyanobacterium LEGE 10410]
MELNKVRLSPTLLTLVTSLTLGLSLPARAENNRIHNQLESNVVTNGAALLQNIKSSYVAQNPNPPSQLPLPSDSEPQIDPNRELPEFEPPQSEPPGGEGDRAPNNTEDTTPQSSDEPRVLVAEVVVAGADEELEDIVYATVGTEPGRTTTRTQLQEDVNAVYATGFFQNVEVTPEDTQLGVRITFAVEPNPILSDVQVQTIAGGNESEVLPPNKVDEFFGENYGQILNLRELQEGIIRVNEWYSNNGYELAQVVGAPQVSPEGEVTLVVAEGVIEDIQVRYFDEDDEPIEGKTREFVITREVELDPGDVFKRDIAQRDLQRVFGLGVFEDARFSFSPGTDPSRVIVNIDVVEGSSGSVAAGAGYSSDSGLFGTASYQQKNLGGNNQTLGTEVQIGDDNLLFNVNFTDPWIAGSESRTSYTINAFRRRSISLVFNGDNDIDIFDDDSDSPRIVRTGGGISFARPLPSDPFSRREWTLSTGFQYQRVEVKDDDGEIASVGIRDDAPELGTVPLAFSDDGTDDLFTLRFGATRDRRNNPLQPTQGSVLRVGTEQTIPIGSGSILLNRLRANYSQYFPVNLVRFNDGPEALAFNLQAGTILGDLPTYEAFILGGSNSVRGFDDGELGSGRSFFQASAEYRFPIFRIVGGALFFDYGTTLGTDDNVPGSPSIVRELPGSGFGYGLGVRIQSPLGPIRVDYAFNDDGDNQIQFGIGEKF